MLAKKHHHFAPLLLISKRTNARCAVWWEIKSRTNHKHLFIADPSSIWCLNVYSLVASHRYIFTGQIQEGKIIASDIMWEIGVPFSLQVSR